MYSTDDGDDEMNVISTKSSLYDVLDFFCVFKVDILVTIVISLKI